ncbi:MAG: NADH-quinone oxidoreductase subunit H [Candidatus Binatia bacterium]|jgi:NADH-quinone oxidoreductase subunit H
MEFLDQIFIWTKTQVVGALPDVLQVPGSILLSILPIMAVFPLLFALTTVAERKILGRIQNRLGPNRVGPFGFLQWAADGIKTITKEDLVPRNADKIVHFLAPVALLAPVLLAYSVLPFGRGMYAIELDAGLLFFFAVGAGTELAVFMAGWSSRNKYSLLGAMRAVAQMISYELPLLLSAVSVVMIVGSLNPNEIVAAQEGFKGAGGLIPNWHVFTPWGLAGFGLFMIAAAAESNRSPFDLPEAESEIIAGYFVEYSGMKFATFFLAEYLGLFVISSLGIVLFLGGWHAPAPFALFEIVPSWAWFMGKLVTIIFCFIWVRGTLPRLRIDQLMNFAWKFMLPMTLINLLVVAIWQYALAWDFVGAGLLRWLICGGLLVGPYLALGQGLMNSRNWGKRTYRYAS